MKNKQIKWIGAAVLSLILIAVAAPSAFTEPAELEIWFAERFEGGGHLLFLESPERFNPLVAGFLS